MITPASYPRVVADHYLIDRPEPIGSGGMAFVYHGRDMRTRRDVALKTLKPEWANNPEARARFRHEARTMAFLTHPNVARVYDLFEPDDLAPPWVVLEFIPGPSLRQEIDRHGPIDLDRLVHLLRQVASALDHLHKRGMVHLDVKPQNLLFADPMTLKLIDFGIAQRSWTVPEQVNGQSFGTLGYLSPEHATGREVGPPSDIYSLGCVVYEMISGRAPFASGPDVEPAEVVAAHINDDPTPPTQVNPLANLPPWVDDIVLDALQKNPDNRYSSTIALADAFENALNFELPPDSTVPLGDLPRFDPRRNPVVVPDPKPIPVVRRGSPPFVRRIPVALLWKMIFIVAVGNVLLAALSWFVDGVVPGLYEPRPGLSDAAQVRVVAEALNVRESADPTSQIVGQLNVGMVIEIDGSVSEGWVPVTFDSGQASVQGFVSADHVETIPVSGQERLRRVVESWLP